MHIILLFVLSSSLNPDTANDLRRVSHSDLSVVSKDKSLIFRIQIATESEHKKYLDSSKNISFWGVSAGNSRNVIESIDVTYNGEKMYVPYIAFSDLTNVDSVSYVSGNRYSVFKLLGGDDGSGYRVYFYFDRGEIVRRKVESRTFPDNFHSVTLFRNNPIEE